MAAHTGGAAAAAATHAIKATGGIVRMSPENFQTLIGRARDSVVVHATGWLFGTEHRYVVSYKGLVFATRSREKLFIPSDIEIIEAERIWIPA